MTQTIDPKTRRDQLVFENLADLSRMFDTLDDDRWDEASLCEGWRVRDIAGHFILGLGVPARTVAGKVFAGGFRLNTVVARESRAIGSEKSVDELRSEVRALAESGRYSGIVAKLPKKHLLADGVTHVLDVSVPLDLDVAIPDERLHGALDLLVRINDWGSKKRARGLRLVATDIDWSHGDGPEVKGDSRHLILALGGRAGVTDRLSGEGVDILASRIG